MLLLASLLLLAQQPQTTFRSGVDRVAVDVVVVDGSGRPVTDLTAADFTLSVDGKRRTIASAEFVSLARLEDPGPAPAHYSTNLTNRAGRMIMIAIDQNNIRTGTGRLAFEAAAKFLATLNPNDRVGIHLIPGASPILDFTSNHALAAEMLKQAIGRAPSAQHGVKVGISEARAIVRGDQNAVREVIERECSGNMSNEEMQLCQRLLVNDARVLVGSVRSRTTETLVGLRELMRRLRPGRTRKTVMLLSEGLVLDRGLEDVSWIAQAAAESQVSLYVMELESSPFEAGSARVSPSRSADRALEREGLELLAGLSGGTVIPLSQSNPWSGFSRVSTEVSGYYLLSFEPDAAERDGRTHKIDIDVARRGVTLRARREFAMDGPPDATSLGPRLGEALRSPVDLTGIGIKIAPYVLRDASGKLKVIIASEIDRTRGPATDGALGFTLSDRDGKLAGSDVEPSLGPHKGLVEHFASALIVDPGLYSIRYAAVDAAGREGSAGHTFDARLHGAGQLYWSDLLLSEQHPATQKIALLTDGPSGTIVQAYLELYSDVPAMLDGTSVTLEISRREDGVAIASAPVVFSAAQDGGRRTGEARIDIAALGSGEFVARAIIRSGGRESGRAIRPFTVRTRQP